MKRDGEFAVVTVGGKEYRYPYDRLKKQNAESWNRNKEKYLQRKREKYQAINEKKSDGKKGS